MDIVALLQTRAQKCDAQQAIVAKAVTEGRGMTAEEKTAYDSLQNEINGLNTTVEAAQAIEERNKKLNLSLANERQINLGNQIDPSIHGQVKLDDGGFKNLGEMIFQIRNMKTGKPMDSRLQNLATSDVGIMIPPQFSQNIMRQDVEEEIVMPNVGDSLIPAGDPPDAPFAIPYFRQGELGELGGIQVNWSAESAPIQDVGTPQIKDLTLTPNEVVGLATINNKTLDNWQAAGSFYESLMQQAVAVSRDQKFLKGSGAGCPKGIYNSEGAIWIPRNTSATIKYIDTLNMLAQIYDGGPGDMLYVANRNVMPTLMTLRNDAGWPIFNSGDATKGVPPTLNGVKLRWNYKTPALGTAGDLALIKFRYYLIKQGSGPFFDISKDFKFNTAQTVFRIVARMDGQPWVKEPLLMQDGVTLTSPYVFLAQ